MISEEDVEKALDYLRDNAPVAAQVRANRIYLEEYRKSQKALIMNEYSDDPLGAQERNAYSDPRYLHHLEVIRTAVEADEKNRYLREAAMAKIDAWKVQSWNERSMKL